jgi:hypothetical protein
LGVTFVRSFVRSFLRGPSMGWSRWRGKTSIWHSEFYTNTLLLLCFCHYEICIKTILLLCSCLIYLYIY